MYSINAKSPNFGLSDTAFQDVDFVRIRITLAYGKDTGDLAATGNIEEKNYDGIW